MSAYRRLLINFQYPQPPETYPRIAYSCASDDYSRLHPELPYSHHIFTHLWLSVGALDSMRPTSCDLFKHILVLCNLIPDTPQNDRAHTSFGKISIHRITDIHGLTSRHVARCVLAYDTAIRSAEHLAILLLISEESCCSFKLKLNGGFWFGTKDNRVQTNNIDYGLSVIWNADECDTLSRLPNKVNFDILWMDAYKLA